LHEIVIFADANKEHAKKDDVKELRNKKDDA